MGVPTVNIGSRQRGRLKANSIIDCAEDRDSIVHAVNQALTPEFREKAATKPSLYGNCDASTLIVDNLSTLNVARWHSKRFYDLPA